MRSAIASFTALATICIALTGCPSSDFGYVEGTLTIDGEPIDGALIGFYPEGGRGSIGATDSNGHYELLYTSAQKGASIGVHKVTIETAIKEVKAGKLGQLSGYDVEMGEAPQEAVAGRKALIDKSYSKRKTTPLTATVIAGSNPPIDFKLESGSK